MRSLFCFLVIALWVACGCSPHHTATTAPDPIITFGPTPPRGVDTEPSWNPTGTALVYVHDVNDPIGTQLRILDITSGSSTSIGYGLNPKWSPDGTKIASWIGGNLQLYDLATLTWTLLTQDGRSFSPSWSSDSKQLVFELAPADVGPHAGLWILDLASGQLTDAIPQLEGYPCWAPGDSGLVFVSSYPRDSQKPFVFPSEIAMYSFATGEFTRLTNDAYDNRNPAVSPDGTRIAWLGLSGSATTPSGIFVSPFVGGSTVLIDTLGEDPAWSPDGSRIAYAGYNRESNSHTLWLMKPDGSGKVQLTKW